MAVGRGEAFSSFHLTCIFFNLVHGLLFDTSQLEVRAHLFLRASSACFLSIGALAMFLNVRGLPLCLELVKSRYFLPFPFIYSFSCTLKFNSH